MPHSERSEDLPAGKPLGVGSFTLRIFPALHIKKQELPDTPFSRNLDFFFLKRGEFARFLLYKETAS